MSVSVPRGRVIYIRVIFGFMKVETAATRRTGRQKRIVPGWSAHMREGQPSRNLLGRIPQLKLRVRKQANKILVVDNKEANQEEQEHA